MMATLSGYTDTNPAPRVKGRKGMKMMKVMVSQESKKYLTAEEYDNAKRLAKHMKEEEDEWGVADYAKLAAGAAGHGQCIEIFKASATVAGNARAMDLYFEGSGRLDIWIEATAQTTEGFVIIGAYLSDIWGITGSNDKNFRGHAYIRSFKESK